MDWYYTLNEQQQGPVTQEQLSGLLQDGTINAETMLWREGMADWRARNASGDCIFVCELGPPEYAMTGPDGREMSNRWEEAQVIKGWVEEIWDELGGDG